jgi:hypothetical protein
VSDEIIDLSSERAKRERPDSEFIRKDDFGREMFCFALSYDMGGEEWCTQVWAYDIDDAKLRVAAQRDSLRLDGQLFGTVSS